MPAPLPVGVRGRPLSIRVSNVVHLSQNFSKRLKRLHMSLPSNVVLGTHRARFGAWPFVLLPVPIDYKTLAG